MAHNKEEFDPLLGSSQHPMPGKGRIVTPFQISYDNSIPIVPDAPSLSNREKFTPDVDALTAKAKAMSRQINGRVNNSSIDGSRIVDEERTTAYIANFTAQQQTQKLDHRIKQANIVDDPEPDVVLPVPTIAPSAPAMPEMPPVHQKYDIPAYKSMYEDHMGGTTYSPQEYKSIYD